MGRNIITRRAALVAGGAAFAATASGLMMPAQAQGLSPTKTMRGGSNNYRRDAKIVDRIGGGGFTMQGTVRRAGDGMPLAGQRIQIWAHTTEGHERDAHSHGIALTDENGVYTMDMPQIVPAFGQAHGHLACENEGFETVFLRPLLDSPDQTSLTADFVLAPA